MSASPEQPNVEQTPIAPTPAMKSNGVTLDFLSGFTVSVEIPDLLDPVTNEPVVVSFECERKPTGKGSELARLLAELTQREADNATLGTEAIGHISTDMRGLSDFPRDARPYVERFREYWSRNPGVAESVLLIAWGEYNERLGSVRATDRIFRS